MLKKISIILLLITFSFAVLCRAEQDSETISLLKQNIESAASAETIEPQLKELRDAYVSENRFDELYDFLAALEQDKRFNSSPLIYYYATSTRFDQMKFLEDNKMWEVLFDNKDLYESQMQSDLEKAKKLITSTDALSLKLKLLEWQLIKDDQQASINALEDLFNLAQGYIQEQDDMQVIKNIADELANRNENNYAKKLYSVYVAAISETDISQKELNNLAESFLEEGKIDYAISLYEAYLEKAADTQVEEGVIIGKMFDIAQKFVHSGWQEGLDPFYAEKVYQKIDSLYSQKVFSGQAQYQRAYNLERSKEHNSCLVEYLELVTNFPKYKDKDRIYFRLGVISAYIFAEIDEAKEYFLKVAEDYPNSVDYLNSLYHLGLLDHWQGNTEAAMKHYLSIQRAMKDVQVKPEIAELSESRIKEIVEGEEIGYNLRTFLEATLADKEEKKHIQLELYAKSAKENKGNPIKFLTNSYFLDTGCIQQDFTYLWSGQLGDNQAPFNEDTFQTSYPDLGTKVVNVVLVGPSGAVDGTIEIADIYNGIEKEQ